MEEDSALQAEMLDRVALIAAQPIAEQAASFVRLYEELFATLQSGDAVPQSGDAVPQGDN